MFELIDDIMNAILKLVFIVYILILIAMACLGAAGITSPIYFVSEIVMMIVGYIIFRVRRDCYGPNSFPVIWAVCTLVGFWPILVLGPAGMLITVVARFLYLIVCFKAP